MANPADHYDPLADLGHAVDKMPLAGLTTPPDGRIGALPMNVDSFDPTANTGTTTVEKMPLATFRTPGDNGLRLPQGAENFDSLNLTPGPKHPLPPGRKFENAGTGEG